MKPWGIKKRVVFLAITPVAVIAIALTTYFLVVRYGNAEAALRNRGESMVRQLAPAAEYGTFSGNRHELLRLAQSAAREPDVIAVTILDATYQPLATAGRGSPHVETTKFVTNGRMTSGGEATELFHVAIRQPNRAFDDPFQSNEAFTSAAGAPIGHVVVELSRNDLDTRKREILLVTLTVTITTLAISLLLAYRLGRDITEPVTALERAVARVRAGHQDVRLRPHRSGTLASLEEGFNEMAAELDTTHRRSANALAHSEEELARQLQIAEAKKEEAERASEGKSRFLAAASHDLRQPLHALTLFASELGNSQGADNRRLAAQIGTAAGAMSELLDALLEASRLDLGAISPHRQAVALGPLLVNAADAYRQTARIKGLRLTCRPTSAWVDTDPHLLRRLLGNLIVNAVRYTQHGRILIAARNRGASVRIEVWDTGIGIEPDHLPHIFHEFYQVDNAERSATKGLGLGLAIVARLGELLDHRIDVASRPGRGSVFAVTVPKAMSAAPEVRAETSPPHSRIAVHMAAIAKCQEIGHLLPGWGYQSQCASDYHDLPPLLATEPAALIADSAGLDGVAAALRGAPRAPLLIVIGGDGPGRFAGIPIAGQLAMPLRPARLRALLHHLLRERVDDVAGADGTRTASSG
mgnify:FL=1